MVIDTNVFLHFEHFLRFDWPSLLAEDSVVLVLPLVVLDELDKAKEAPRKALRRRAAQVLVDLDEYLIEAPTKTPRDGVDIALLADESSHIPFTHGDTEIIDRAVLLGQLLPGRTALISGDRGMSARARSRSLEVLRMPESARRLLEDDE